jgi:tripartite-type tricarboxylate transporter receptor subunit TctC
MLLRFLSSRRDALGIAAVTLVNPRTASAQGAAYPSRPVRLLVPFPPGGAIDLLSRALAEALAPRFRQPVAVENRAGAGGNVAAEALARSEPDGHTLLVATIGVMAINSHVYPRLSFDPDQDLVPIAHLWNTALALVVPAASPHRSVDELAAAGRATGTRLTCGTSGNGTSDHMAMTLFAERSGLDLVHIPYRAGGPAVAADLIGGRIDMTIGNVPSYLGGIRGGHMRALAVTGTERWPALPEVPTMAEAGVPNVVVFSWAGLVGPRGLPNAMRDRLSTEVAMVFADPAYRRRLINIGGVPVGAGSTEFAAFIARESLRWGEVVRRLGIRAE